VYRGLYKTSTDASTLHPENRTGVHWTNNIDVARRFASYEDPGDPWADGGEKPRPGLVLEAQISPEHEIKPGTKEHSEAQFDWGVGPDWEEERTIRPGAPIRVTRHHYIKDGKIVRSEDVNYEGRA
jgi:hypothetical protein